jgi:SOS-response transcriptional repressor LexA
MPLCGNKTIRFTKKDATVLGFIRGYAARTGRPPTYVRIAAEMGVSRSAAHFRVRRLVALGLVTVEPWKHRSIRVLSPSSRARGPRPSSSIPERV